MAKSPLTRITIKHATPDKAIMLKYQLLQAGLIQGKDFEWSWTKLQDPNDWNPVIRVAHFDFVNPALASFYQLKWT